MPTEPQSLARARAVIRRHPYTSGVLAVVVVMVTALLVEGRYAQAALGVVGAALGLGLAWVLP